MNLDFFFKIARDRRVRAAFTLMLYILATMGIYFIACHFIHRPFTDLELLYSALVGCVAYLPRFIARQRAANKKNP
ncbi:MAG: hypothetical protein LBN29_14495 [Mediterranea sp.]|jgi:hypothetical protein|nr:hypothetical protein [Mediterranea sp.]